MTPPANGRGFSRPVRPVGAADNDGEHGAMIEQPDDNPYAPVSPGQALAPDPDPDPDPVTVTLPDGRRLEFADPVTGGEIAAAIGPGLAKAAIAIRVDGKPRDIAAASHRGCHIPGGSCRIRPA